MRLTSDRSSLVAEERIELVKFFLSRHENPFKKGSFERVQNR